MRQPNTVRRGGSLRKGLKRLLIVLLIYALSSMLISAVVFRVLFPRYDGDPGYRLCYAEIDQSAYPRETFTFLSGDNTLAGCRYDVADPKGLIVVINGIGAGADAHLPEILYFLDRGWSVVTWDATGVGESEGRGIIGLQQIRLDLLAFLDTQQARSETLPIVLYGHSAGAYAAATALDGEVPIRAAVCVCGFDSPISLMYYHAKARVGPIAALQYPFLLLENVFLFGSEADVSATEAIRRSQRPVLLIESSSDDRVPHDCGLLRDETITDDPNVSSLTVDAAWRNEHSTPWLSSAAAAYVTDLPEDAAVDKALANELDETYMEQVTAFFEAAVAQP